MILPSQLVDKGYSFESDIKGGGQSHTYLLKKNNEQFLLKIPLASTLSTEQKFRFKQEAKALQLLGGKGAPNVIEFDFENETPFILMEYIQGKTLGDFVNGKPVSLETALTILEKLVAVVSRIHEIGLQHRDIKPDNIILNDDGEIVLIDFGLCRIENENSEFKTPNGKELGNRFLRLPELGKGEKITSSVSDVTFLTGIFYYLLTGKQPNQLLDETNSAPHRKASVKEIFKDFDWINQTFDKGFAYSIAQRFQTAGELLSFITMNKDKVRDLTQSEEVEKFNQLLNSHAYNRLNEILTFLISAHNKFNEGLEYSIGNNVRTNGVNPQIDDSGYAVKTNMFILPASRQNPRIWWINVSTVSPDLTTILHECFIDNTVVSSSQYSVIEQERINQEYYETGIATGKTLLIELLRQMQI